MSIAFTPEDWAKIRTDYGKWWAKELERPLVPILLAGRDPGRPCPDAPLLSQQTCTDFSVSPERLIDRIDYELSCYEYLGDSFPVVNFDAFGPGVAAAFLGAVLDNASGGVWFHPPKDMPIDELHFEYDPDNKWLRRIKDIYAAGLERWGDSVLMSLPDLGGTLDILATFRPAEELLFDLYDDPDEVKRLTWEIHELWLRFFNELGAMLQPVCPGYTDWAKIYCDKPSYVVQCDFSYMISPKHFDEFVKPELQETCRALEHTLYHLDGIGALNHLDSLLTIPELDAVQWVPGDGKPPQEDWPEVLEKIRAAGKNLQLNGGLRGLEKVVKQFGSGKGIHVQPVTGTIDRRDEYMAILAKHGVI